MHRAQGRVSGRAGGRPVTSSIEWARLEMQRGRAAAKGVGGCCCSKAVGCVGEKGLETTRACGKGKDERCDGFKLGSQWFSIGRAEWLRIRGLLRVPLRLKWHRARQPKVWTGTRASSALGPLQHGRRAADSHCTHTNEMAPLYSALGHFSTTISP